MRRKGSWLAAVLAAGGLLFTGAVGCNPLALFMVPAYLSGAGPKEKVKFPFPKDAKRIAVVVTMPHSLQLEVAEAAHFDREMNEVFSRILFDNLEGAGAKGERQIIRAAVVQKWLDKHPDWQTIQEVGKGLGADHVIVVELERINFFEQGSRRTLYRGHVELGLSVHRILEGDESEVILPRQPLTVDFPSQSRPMPVGDISWPCFRELFIMGVATRVSWWFVPHETGDECELAPIPM